MPRYTTKDIQNIDELIKKEYDRKTAYTVAFLAGSKFTASFIRKRAHKLGFKPYKRKVEWTSLDIDYVFKNYQKLSVLHMANYLDVEVNAVKLLLHKLGLLTKKRFLKNKCRLRNVLGACSDDYSNILSSMWNASL
ncbi:hypothetical protein JOC37_002554 [Desulfohalotomaculum tongense]|uniref:hypothetical protein n=1 Tax=Desulforadius tongensis TaxID=1216062 RepID=UPI00195F094D|nr:hypothetical protein [Desulforadius tongensis]MBM7856124.1 hypothetical protein [Desulforadius tongensis]